MRMWMLTAGAAALAITAPALADPKGGGKDKGGQQAHQGGGKAKAEHGSRGGANGRFQGGGHDRQQMVAGAHSGGDKNRGHDQVGKFRGKDQVRHVRVEDAQRGKHDRSAERAFVRDRDDHRDRIRVVDLDNDDGFVGRWGRHGFARGFIDGCPPGLAKKDNGCLPPGQAKKLVGTILPTAFRTNALIGPYRDWYRDDDRFFYRTGPDGYIYRVNRTNSLIDALIPSYLNDYSYYPVGMAYPSAYNYYNVPMQYAGYWPDNDDYYYRYGNGAIYQIDPRTSMIQSIVALLAGDLSVGQRLPLGYSAYNVPFAYRDQYYDTSDAWYRYNDGYIYQVDPTTQLITAVIRALT
jgi:hypothetical protein